MSLIVYIDGLIFVNAVTLTNRKKGIKWIIKIIYGRSKTNSKKKFAIFV
jgi:hypothetical protein